MMLFYSYMKRISVPHIISLYSIFKQKSPFLRFLFFFLIFNAYLILRIPEIYDNFWAEDGSYFYTQFLNNPSLDFMFEFAYGYYLLIDRLIVIPLYFVSPYFVTYLNAFLVIMIQACFASRICFTLSHTFRSKSLPVIYSIFIFILPISAFESVGAATGLHFQLNFMCVFVLYKLIIGSPIDKIDFSILTISFLSGPLSLLIIPVFLLKSKILFILFRTRPLFSCLVILSALIQCWAIFTQIRSDSRSLNSDYSFVKSLYLFFERIIAINFFPGWSHVDSYTLYSGGMESLWIRLATILIILSFASVLFFLINKDTGKTIDLMVLAPLLLSALLLWFIPAVLFNGEPRYAVAPTAIFVLVLFVLIDSLAVNEKNRFAPLVLPFIILHLSLVVTFNSDPSKLRIEGESFNSQIREKLIKCQNNKDNIQILVRPSRYKIVVDLPCYRLLDK